MTDTLDQAPPMALAAMREFVEAHSLATRLLYTATEDYAAARCLLLNLLFPGLILGAQAIEKYLKAFLLLDDPKLDVKKLGHSLPTLLELASKLDRNLQLFDFKSLVEKFNRHYLTRYPDNSGASTNKTTADRHELDELVLRLNENLHCPRSVRYRTGLYAAITFSVDHGYMSPTEEWIKHDNRSLLPLLEQIEANQRVVLKELYP